MNTRTLDVLMKVCLAGVIILFAGMLASAPLIHKRIHGPVAMYQATLTFTEDGRSQTIIMYTKSNMATITLPDGSTLVKSGGDDDSRIVLATGSFRRLNTVPIEVSKEDIKRLREKNVASESF